jgi:transcriptional regulator with XRE-family HTH domain
MTPEKLKAVMAANNLSQKAVSELFFVSLKRVNNWVNGKSAIPKGAAAHFRRMGINVPDDSWIDNPNKGESK